MSIPALIPDRREPILSLCKQCIDISKREWDCQERSWDFAAHPFLTIRSETGLLEDAFERWSAFKQEERLKLKESEEELNAIFIDNYGLGHAVTPAVEDEDITIHNTDREKDMKAFLSYAVGCMFGRYSLDEQGLVYAGGKFEPDRYRTFSADRDNIIPILSGANFDEDIVSKFFEFVKVTFGAEKLAENLDYIAESIGKKEGDTAKETIAAYFLTDFFKDHVQAYKKKPVYWLFSSGKQKAFNCLIYMQRYDKTTLSRIRTDYLHEQQIRFDAEKKALLGVIQGDGTAKEISAAKKAAKALDLKIEELKAYDELLHHMADMQIEIDLDDGVTANVGKFGGLLAKLE